LPDNHEIVTHMTSVGEAIYCEQKIFQ